jgi:hypothetical protein
VIEIRGQGLMIGIELDRACGDLVKMALAEKMLINVTNDNVVRLLPPLVMTQADAELLTEKLARLIRTFWAERHARPVKHFLQFKDLTRAELEHLFLRTRVIKERFKRYQPYHPLADRTLAMIFEKSSTRTRLSFEAGMHQMGGSAIYLNTRDTQLGRGEPVEDAAEVISRMVDVVMIRTFRTGNHRTLCRAFARAGDQRADQ